MQRKRDYEVIVLGLGGIGSGALYWLSRRLGDDVLGIEQFELGHDRGGSQDHSRIIRYSYHSPTYVRLAHGAYETWAHVERESDRELVVKTGGLDLFPTGGAIPMHDYTESLTACEVPFELIDAGEVMRRWPAFRVADGTLGLVQADTGFVRAADANAAHRDLALRHGAVLLESCPISAVRVDDGEVEVDVADETYRAGKLVVAAGAWTNEILPRLRLPLTVTREQVLYFEPTDPAAVAVRRFPVWIWMDAPSFYGFPHLPGAGLKVAEDVGGEEVTAGSRTFDPDPVNRARVEEFCAEVLPGAIGAVREIKTCLYTLTPDRDFVIDHVPGMDNVFVAIGAGHAFKFASQIGRILSELALDGVTDSDIEPFRITRPILGEENPPTRFLV